ncbi:hypothetical protein ACQEUU_31055 [Nonomuraea sp. CA-218870]|uniref:hypothetical protein n=1 Tax=Nonomuraea sp. CA-218870 TaxID=3239998 RepID=UPI003D8C03CB
MTEVSTLSPAIDELWERPAELSPADEQARAAVVAAVVAAVDLRRVCWCSDAWSRSGVKTRQRSTRCCANTE